MFTQHDLFEPGRYFKECHAAYITEMPSRTLYVSFFGGTREKARDVGSWIVTKPIDATGWSTPRLFIKAPKKSTGTTHFFVTPDRSEVWAFYNLMQGNGWSTCNQVRHVYRNGRWGEMEYMRRMVGYCTRGKILVMDNGDWLHPVHDELLGYKAYFFVSSNCGRSWRKTGPVKTRKGCLEPTVVQLANGRLLCFLRTKEREIYQALSADRGRTWTRAHPTGLPNPDSMVELLVLPSGTVVLAYNDSTTGRSPLCLARSTDNARSWSSPRTIARAPRGEFSYPCMIHGSDGHVHLVYTNMRRTITYARFDEAWLTSG